jgi:hypothetical protein
MISNYIALVKFDYKNYCLLCVMAFSLLEVHQRFEETHYLHFHVRGVSQDSQQNKPILCLAHSTLHTGTPQTFLQ